MSYLTAGNENSSNIDLYDEDHGRLRVVKAAAIHRVVDRGLIHTSHGKSIQTKRVLLRLAIAVILVAVPGFKVARTNAQAVPPISGVLGRAKSVTQNSVAI